MNSSRMPTALRQEYWVCFIIFILVAAVVLRLWHIDLRSLSHPEIYIPGIDLVPGISQPPPRHDWAYSIWWSFHDEPHAFGYYIGMQIWTTIAGTSEFALRLPGAVMGVLSILVATLLTTRIYGRAAGALVAVLLTLHGFHILWSQTARMYAPAMFLGVVSTMILVHLSQLKRGSWPWEVAYIACVLAGTLTFEFFWPLAFLQVGWISVIQAKGLGANSEKLSFRRLWLGCRLSQVQSITLTVSAPTLLHAAYRARNASLEPDVNFLPEYFKFGFVLYREAFSPPEFAPPMIIGLVALLVCIALIIVSFRGKPIVAGPAIASGEDTSKPISGRIRILIAVLVTIFMIWLAMIAHDRKILLAGMTLLPLMALALPAVVLMTAKALQKLKWVHAVDAYQLLFILLAVVPPLLIFIISFVIPLLAPRAFLVFVPYMVIITAVGLTVLPGGRLVQAGVSAVVIFIFAQSAVDSYQKPGSPNDYKRLAQAMQLKMNADDLILIRSKNWVDTPFFYYLPKANYITEEYSDVVAQNPDRRFWLVTWPDTDGTWYDDARAEAVKDLKPVEELTALRASAVLYEHQ